MAYLDKEGYLRYTHEEEEMFEEISSNFTQKGIRTPWADSIIKSLLGELSND